MTEAQPRPRVLKSILYLHQGRIGPFTYSESNNLNTQLMVSLGFQRGSQVSSGCQTGLQRVSNVTLYFLSETLKRILEKKCTKKSNANMTYS